MFIGKVTTGVLHEAVDGYNFYFTFLVFLRIRIVQLTPLCFVIINDILLFIMIIILHRYNGKKIYHNVGYSSKIE